MLHFLEKHLRWVSPHTSAGVTSDTGVPSDDKGCMDAAVSSTTDRVVVREAAAAAEGGGGATAAGGVATAGVVAGAGADGDLNEHIPLRAGDEVPYAKHFGKAAHILILHV